MRILSLFLQFSRTFQRKSPANRRFLHQSQSLPQLTPAALKGVGINERFLYKIQEVSEKTQKFSASSARKPRKFAENALFLPQFPQKIDTPNKNCALQLVSLKTPLLLRENRSIFSETRRNLQRIRYKLTRKQTFI